MSDGSHPQCISCRKIYYKENLVKIKIYNLDNRDSKKEYYLKNRDKNSIPHEEYIKNCLKNQMSIFVHNRRRRIHHASKIKLKSSSTMDTLGIDFNTHRKWIEFQMTPDMKWKNIDIDRVRHISSFHITDDEQLKEPFNWKNT